jgi:tripartite-type tricarboxylate transporter receptor subunit TctC
MSLSAISCRLAPALLIVSFSMPCAGAADPVRDYPQRPVRFVAPFSAGGNAELIGRILAPKLSEKLGQNFLIENRPGAGGVVGANYVAKATPDGHTLLLLSGAFTATAASTKALPYDPVRDFAWISLLVTYPFVAVVRADSPLHTVADLINAAKKNPGKLNYATVGAGSVFHLASELFNGMAGVDTMHIPYKGSSEPITELIGGRIDFIFITLTGVQPHIQSKRLRALAIASKERSPQLPNLPTVAETLPGYEVTSFAAIGAPAATPRSIIARLNREVRASLTEPDVRKRLEELGGDVRPTTQEEATRHIQGEIGKWKRIVETRKLDVQ